MQSVCQILLFLFLSGQVLSQSYVLTGTVFSEGNNPVEYANVMIKEMSKGAVTDSAGFFQFSNIPTGQYHLSISYIGMESQIIPVEVRQDSSVVHIILKPIGALIEEITIVDQSLSGQQQERPLQIESVDLNRLVSQVKDPAEAIDLLSGVRARSSGSMGGKTDISLNGLHGTAVRIYLNGLPMEFLYPGYDLANLPVGAIDRIDVYKGIVPLDIGTDALGGGINVVSSPNPYTSLKATYSIGSFQTHQANVNANWKIDDGVFAGLNTSFNSSQNNYTMEAYVWEEREYRKVRRFHDGYRMFFTDGSINITDQNWADDFRVNVHMSRFNKELQNGQIIDRLAYGEAHYSGDNLRALLSYDKNLTSWWNVQTFLSAAGSQMEFVDTTANRYSWSGDVIRRTEQGEYGDAVHSERDQKNLINRTNFSFDLGKWGILLLSNLWARQKVTGRDNTRPEDQDFLTYPQDLTKDIWGAQYTNALFQQKIEFSLASKTYYFHSSGVEARSFTPIDKKDHLSGYFATIKYNINPNTFLRSSYEHAWRIPEFNQFFGNGNVIIPNTSLKPESSDNFNIGAVTHFPVGQQVEVRLEANGFLRDQKDIIFLASGELTKYQNAEEVRSVGGELELRIELYDRFSWISNVTKLRKTYQAIDESNLAGQFLVGTPFPNTPDLYINSRIQYRLGHNRAGIKVPRVYLQYKFVERFNYINEGKVYNPDNYVPAQHRIDVGFTTPVFKDKLMLSGSLNNVFDQENFDNYKIPRPGRNFNLKLTYEFKKLKN